MPNSREREELAALIGLEVLIESVAFDTHDLRKLPFNSTLVTRVLRSLRRSRVLEKVNTRKYLFTDRFAGTLKVEVLSKTPRSGLMQFPAMTIFDMCGIDSWTERDVEHFVKRLRQHWNDVAGKQRA